MLEHLFYGAVVLLVGYYFGKNPDKAPSRVRKWADRVVDFVRSF